MSKELTMENGTTVDAPRADVGQEALEDAQDRVDDGYHALVAADHAREHYDLTTPEFQRLLDDLSTGGDRE